MTDRIVVLGAGYAGLGAAKRAARRLQGAGAQVTLVNASDRFVSGSGSTSSRPGSRFPICRFSTCSTAPAWSWWWPG